MAYFEKYPQHIELKIQGSVFNTVEVTMPLTVEDADAIKENASDLVVEVLALAEVGAFEHFRVEILEWGSYMPQRFLFRVSLRASMSRSWHQPPNCAILAFCGTAGILSCIMT